MINTIEKGRRHEVEEEEREWRAIMMKAGRKAGKLKKDVDEMRAKVDFYEAVHQVKRLQNELREKRMLARLAKAKFFENKGNLDRIYKPYERTMNSLEREKD
jgi:hypothetical protein